MLSSWTDRRVKVCIRGVFDKFEEKIDNILIPKRKVLSILSWKLYTNYIKINVIR